MPEVVNLGLSHDTAPIEVRELVAFTKKKQGKILSELNQHSCCRGAVLLNTCNRCEVYVSTTDVKNARRLVFEVLQRETEKKIQLESFLFSHRSPESTIHLFEVASGLDSMIKGEPQILGQTKEAYEFACQGEFCDTYLHEAFTRAIRTGKRARAETDICSKAASMGYAAVELARQVLPGIEDCRTLIIGAGEMGKVVLKNLLSQGAARPAIANRSIERSKKLAEQFQGRAIPMLDLAESIADFDVIISSTSAPHSVVYKDRHGDALLEREDSQLFIDLAVPRDIDPELALIDKVNLYMVDDLEEIVTENLEERLAETEKVNEIIQEEYGEFKKWLAGRQAVPLIKALQERADNIRQAELERAFNKLSSRTNLSEEEQFIIEDLSRRLIQQLLHHPLVNIKNIFSGNGENIEQNSRFDFLVDLFDLEI